jgi:hypothetical protein
MWKSIRIDKGIVIWTDDMYFKLKEYQVYFGEKPGLDVIQTAILPNDYARRVFTQKYGFDPLRDATREALRAPIRQDFVIGSQPAILAHFFAVIQETIVKNASVPIVAFDPDKKRSVLFF